MLHASMLDIFPYLTLEKDGQQQQGTEEYEHEYYY
jgi:hypothetical protein